jgi:hypothetical protein
MTRKALLLCQYALIVVFSATLFFSICEFIGSAGSLEKYNYNNPVYNNKEAFDPSLSRLNSVEKISEYCDSLYQASQTNGKKNQAENYVNIVKEVVKKRFYHGYSTYGFGNNYIALLGEVFYRKGICSIVTPDEILKYPFAACSQQGIIVMQVLKMKDIITRKVGFPPVGGAGHFCVEAYYNGSWHFIDTNMEPDEKTLAAYGFPSAAFLASNKNIVKEAYKTAEADRAVQLFQKEINYGQPNTFPAKFGKLYQDISKYLSYGLWLLLGVIFIIVRLKYLSLTQANVRNSRIFFQKFHKGTPSIPHREFKPSRA